jgi:hypothetical protein
MIWKKSAPMPFVCTPLAYQTSTQLGSWRKAPVNLNFKLWKIALEAFGFELYMIWIISVYLMDKNREMGWEDAWQSNDGKSTTCRPEVFERGIPKTQAFLLRMQNLNVAVYFPCNNDAVGPSWFRFTP